MVHFEHLTVFVDKQVGGGDRKVEPENLQDKVFHAQNLEIVNYGLFPTFTDTDIVRNSAI